LVPGRTRGYDDAMKLGAKIGIGIALAVIAMQAVRCDHGNPPVTGEVPAPAEVKAVLRRACYDCHSNETRWPWYSQIAPVSWLVGRDVKQGCYRDASLLGLRDSLTMPITPPSRPAPTA
jgi:hypothetical protein